MTSLTAVVLGTLAVSVRVMFSDGVAATSSISIGVEAMVVGPTGAGLAQLGMRRREHSQLGIPTSSLKVNKFCRAVSVG
jgi:hypothetical protein